VWLAARESLWNFPIAIVNSLFYGVVYYRTKLYSDSLLQGFFLALTIYGWYEWLYGGRNRTELRITPTSRREWLGGTVFALAYTAGFGYYLQHYTDAALPYVDSFTTGVSLVAQFLLMRKRLENWLLWILVDLIYVPMLWMKQLYPTSLLYALYLGLATYGYLQWRREAAHKPASAL
jgi:nicotinamide mononucleotide transporter